MKDTLKEQLIYNTMLYTGMSRKEVLLKLEKEENEIKKLENDLVFKQYTKR